MRYKNKDYIVKDLGCKKLVDKCFVPFSGNGIHICRRYELGQCPSDDEIKGMMEKTPVVQNDIDFWF